MGIVKPRATVLPRGSSSSFFSRLVVSHILGYSTHPKSRREDPFSSTTNKLFCCIYPVSRIMSLVSLPDELVRRILVRLYACTLVRMYSQREQKHTVKPHAQLGALYSLLPRSDRESRLAFFSCCSTLHTSPSVLARIRQLHVNRQQARMIVLSRDRVPGLPTGE